jgi:putative hydrolase of the HAD superfamily
MAGFDAVCLDVGGVFVVPEHARIAAALASIGVEVERHRFWYAHYHGMHGSDVRQAPPETFGAYVPAFCRNLGLPADQVDAAIAVVGPMFGPSALWCEPIPGSAEGLRALHERGVPLAVVSNADGTVAELLAAAGVCQVGDGPAVPVSVIVDSTAVGIAKPDPAIFRFALDVLGTEPARTLHVGDSVHYDVVGARAAGLHPLHFDPYRLCEALDDHDHIAALTELDRYV